MATMLKSVSPRRAVWDIVENGGVISLDVAGGNIDLTVPIAFPLGLLTANTLNDMVDVIVMPVGDDGDNADWSLQFVSQDPISGYLTFKLINLTAGQQGDKGDFLVAVNRVD